MTKEETLKAIKSARDAHNAQMNKIEKLINGMEVENPTAVAKTECAFGKWLYGEKNHVKEILGEQFFNNLDMKHEEWHTEYTRIYNIFFKDRNKGFFSSLLGLNKIDPMELDKVKLYFIELKEITEELLHALASSERRISAMSETKFHH